MTSSKTAAETRKRRKSERLARAPSQDPLIIAQAATLPAPRVAWTGGEPTAYDPEIAAEICQRLSLGETLNSIVQTPGFPDKRTFNRWTVAYPELRDAWIAARRVKATSLFDEALDLARDLKEGRKAVSSNEVNALRVAIDTLRWAASKLDPGQYGEQAGKMPAVAIQINSNLDLGRGVETSADASLYSFTIKLPSPDGTSPGAEPQRVPADKRKARATVAPIEEGENGA